MDIKTVSFRAGVTVVLATHVYMVYTGDLPQAMMMPHAYINLVAAGLILYGTM